MENNRLRRKMMTTYQFTLNFDVRDYECDLEGIVNNAVYQHYLEHTRHEFLKQRGLPFAEFIKKGLNLVVVRIEIDYLYPLRSGDKFVVGLNLEHTSRIRFGFLQDIYRLPDYKPIVKAKIIGTALNERGRPFLPKELEGLFESVP
jgi:acyl-CoA thioester hydrolase